MIIGDPPEGSTDRVPPTPEQLEAFQRWLRLLAIPVSAIAIAGAVLAYSIEGSVWLSLFVLVLTLCVIGFGAPRVIAGPGRLGAAVALLLLGGISTAIVHFTYQAWEVWWLAVLPGLLFLGLLFFMVLFNVQLQPLVVSPSSTDEDPPGLRLRGSR